MSVQKLIFPGFILGVFGLMVFTWQFGLLPEKDGSNSPSGGVAASFSGQTAGQANEYPCTISRKYPDVIQQWCGLIEKYARENELDPNLVSAVILQESAGKPDAYSKNGAVGLMQVMPRDGKAAAFRCKNGPCFAERPTMNDLFDPEFNVAYGSSILAGLLYQHGNTREALKAYGPMDAGYYYADLVIEILNSYR